MLYDDKNYVIQRQKLCQIKKRGGKMGNNLIIKSNVLIEARYELNLIEQKIILYAVSKLDSKKENFNIISLNAKEFFKLIDTSTERYTELRKIVKKLKSKEITIDTGNGEILTNWLASMEYKKDTGIIDLEFSIKLVPYLLQLKSRFTRYQIKNILFLNNKHSIRIYELLKQYETIGRRSFRVDEFKKILLLENQYKRFSDFERRVLKPTMEEINEQTDININYEKIKRGKEIKTINYLIEPKKVGEYKRYLEENYDIKEIKENTGLQDENFNSEQVMNLYQVSVNKLHLDCESEKDISEYIKINYNTMLDKENIINRYSYLMDLLANDRAKAIVTIRENKKAL